MSYTEHPYTIGAAAGTEVSAEGGANRIEVPESAITEKPVNDPAYVLRGDPVQIGALAGVALNSASAGTDRVVVQLRGIFNLAVKGHDGQDNTGIGIGDPIYIGSDALLDADDGGVLFGYALGAVVSGETTTIAVLLRR